MIGTRSAFRSFDETLVGHSKPTHFAQMEIDSVIRLRGPRQAITTTTAAKIANRLKGQNRKKVLLASLDVQRPAAQEQLEILGRQVGVTSLPIVPGERPIAITRRA